MCSKILRGGREIPEHSQEVFIGIGAKNHIVVSWDSFESGWRNHQGNRFRSLSQAVSQSFPRQVKNPCGTVDQNYLKSTENREKALGLMWSQPLQLRSIPQTPIIFLKPVEGVEVKIWKFKWNWWQIKEQAASWDFLTISVKTESLFFLATLHNRNSPKFTSHPSFNKHGPKFSS